LKMELLTGRVLRSRPESPALGSASGISYCSRVRRGRVL
jgi:hypothetical protein